MRLGQILSPVANYYDRASAPIQREFVLSTLAPHGATQRWTYTVPASRKFLLVSFWAHLRRLTAAATPAVYYTFFTVGGLDWVFFTGIDNTVNALREVQIPYQLVLPPGTVLAGFTEDDSTGGTVEYENGMAGLEFAA